VAACLPAAGGPERKSLLLAGGHPALRPRPRSPTIRIRTVSGSPPRIDGVVVGATAFA